MQRREGHLKNHHGLKLENQNEHNSSLSIERSESMTYIRQLEIITEKGQLDVCDFPIFHFLICEEGKQKAISNLSLCLFS